MKKTVLKISIGVAGLLAAFALYVGIDCFRLSKSDYGTKPLITISDHTDEPLFGASGLCSEYEGLGYKVRYSKYYDETNKEAFVGKQAECRLFDSILLWAWIE